MTADGGLDEGTLRALIDALVPALDGLFVLGSSGELTWLTDEMAARVARVAVDQTAGRIPVYVGAGDTGLTRTLARAERFADVGADYLVVTAPFYYSVSSVASVIGYFETLAERTAAPVILYNIPQNTHLVLAPSTVRVLAGHPNIVGIKDSAGDWNAFESFLTMRSDRFSVMQGRERLAAISLWSGADGLISAIANFAPRLLQALVGSIRDEASRVETLALQATIDALAEVFEQGEWLAGLKGTLQATGWAVGDPSPPIPPYDAAQRRVIEGIVSRPEIAGWLTPAGAATSSVPATPARPSLRVGS